MSELQKLITTFRELFGSQECGVHGCETTKETELVTILPLDPIDHSETPVMLCPEHAEAAKRRNEFTEEIYDEFREARREIGQRHADTISEFALLRDGKLREDVLMGDVDEPQVHASDLLDGGEE